MGPSGYDGIVPFDITSKENLAICWKTRGIWYYHKEDEMDVDREMRKRELAAALQKAAQDKRCFVGSEDIIFYNFAEQLLQIHEARERRVVTT
jgi:hypothetical protein